MKPICWVGIHTTRLNIVWRRRVNETGASMAAIRKVVKLPLTEKDLVPRRKLWVIQGNIKSPARWVGGASPDGTADFVSVMRIAVKPCAYGAPPRGCGA